MPKLSAVSEKRLENVDPRLQTVVRKAIELVDFAVICGHRNKEDQERAFAEKKSKVKWPNSKHNSLPSKAVDLAPYPIDWHDTPRFAFLAGVISTIAAQENVKIRWGGDWDRDGFTKDERFLDMPHFELID